MNIKIPHLEKKGTYVKDMMDIGDLFYARLGKEIFVFQVIRKYYFGITIEEVDPESLKNAVTIYHEKQYKDVKEIYKAIKYWYSKESIIVPKLDAKRTDECSMFPVLVRNSLPAVRTETSLATIDEKAVTEIRHGISGLDADYEGIEHKIDYGYGLFEDGFYEGKHYRITKTIINEPGVMFDSFAASIFEPYFRVKLEKSFFPDTAAFIARSPHLLLGKEEALYFRRINDLPNFFDQVYCLDNAFIMDSRDLKAASAYPYSFTPDIYRPYINDGGYECCYRDLIEFLYRKLHYGFRTVRCLYNEMSSYYQRSDLFYHPGYSRAEMERICKKEFVYLLTNSAYGGFDSRYEVDDGYLFISKTFFELFYQAVGKTKGDITKLSDLRFTNQRYFAFFHLFYLPPEGVSYLADLARKRHSFGAFYLDCFDYCKKQATSSFGEAPVAALAGVGTHPVSLAYKSITDDKLVYVYKNHYFYIIDPNDPSSVEGSSRVVFRSKAYLDKIMKLRPITEEEMKQHSSISDQVQEYFDMNYQKIDASISDYRTFADKYLDWQREHHYIPYFNNLDAANSLDVLYSHRDDPEAKRQLSLAFTTFCSLINDKNISFDMFVPLFVERIVFSQSQLDTMCNDMETLASFAGTHL
ncbi:MAG: hypothetical protein LKE31_03945 [Bacilli bacterium]|jgi:hypothetical protein|nr:hypothetical protein [Bacilli bacterium]